MRIDFPGVEGTIDVYMDVMRAICGPTDGRSMIDLMSCFAPNTRNLGFTHRVYMDVVDRKLDDPKDQKHFIQCDVRDIPYAFMSHQFDVSICSDGIEHLFFEDGFKLLDMMQKISHRQIIFTPLDNIFGIATVDKKDDPELHRSLWHPLMLPEWASIVFPDYHKLYGGGAWFGFKTPHTRDYFYGVVDELKMKPWAKR